MAAHVLEGEDALQHVIRALPFGFEKTFPEIRVSTLALSRNVDFISISRIFGPSQNLVTARVRKFNLCPFHRHFPRVRGSRGLFGRKSFFGHEVAPPGFLEPRPFVPFCTYPVGVHVLGCNAVFAKQPPKMVRRNRLPFGPGSPGPLFVFGELLNQGCGRDFIEAGSVECGLDVGQ